MKATRELAARTFTRVEAEVTNRTAELSGLGLSFDTMAKDRRESEARVREEDIIRASLSRYLPAEIVEKVVKNPGTLKLGGQTGEVTVLFADIVGFTRRSEALPAETVVAILNQHFTVVTEVIHKHVGVIDKFIGDCVMAVLGQWRPAKTMSTAQGRPRKTCATGSTWATAGGLKSKASS